MAPAITTITNVYTLANDFAHRPRPKCINARLAIGIFRLRWRSYYCSGVAINFAPC